MTKYQPQYNHWKSVWTYSRIRRPQVSSTSSQNLRNIMNQLWGFEVWLAIESTKPGLDWNGLAKFELKIDIPEVLFIHCWKRAWRSREFLMLIKHDLRVFKRLIKNTKKIRPTERYASFFQMYEMTRNEIHKGRGNPKL